MDGAIGLGANLPQFSLTQTIRNDGLGGVLARLEVRPFCLLRGVGLLRPDLDVLAASDDLAAFLLLSVGRADLYKFRLRGNLLLDVRFNLGRIAIWVGTLCGIRATGKYFPLARHCRAYRVDDRAMLVAREGS